MVLIIIIYIFLRWYGNFLWCTWLTRFQCFLWSQIIWIQSAFGIIFKCCWIRLCPIHYGPIACCRWIVFTTNLLVGKLKLTIGVIRSIRAVTGFNYWVPESFVDIASIFSCTIPVSWKLTLQTIKLNSNSVKPEFNNLNFLLNIIITSPLFPWVFNPVRQLGRHSGHTTQLQRPHSGIHEYTPTVNENSIKTTFHIFTDQVNRKYKS